MVHNSLCGRFKIVMYEIIWHFYFFFFYRATGEFILFYFLWFITFIARKLLILILFKWKSVRVFDSFTWIFKWLIHWSWLFKGPTRVCLSHFYLKLSLWIYHCLWIVTVLGMFHLVREKLIFHTPWCAHIRVHVRG